METEQQRVILYGDSVVLAGVQASLNAYPHLEVIALREPAATLAETLENLHPAAVIFDLGSIGPGFLQATLPQPHLLLIGVDPNSSQFLVFSGHTQRAWHVADLVRVIHAQL